MEKRSVMHADFTIERTLAADPSRVFKAFSDLETKARWFIGPDHWEKSDHRMDFKIGGNEHVSGGPPGGPIHSYDSTFMDIVENERIITAYEMHLDSTRISVSIATLEFKPEGTGTRLILTEQGAYLDGIDSAESRERGTRDLLDNLAKSLE